jgi:phosphohistidine phosphatase
VKRLFLLRHAKSSWKDTALADHDRPLAKRGKRAAKAMGAYMREQGVDPDLVLCSTAVRARETLELIAPGGRVKVEKALFGAAAEDLLERLRRAPDTAHSILLIGHNPGMHDLAVALTSDPSPQLVDKLPTGALVSLELSDDRWKALKLGDGKLASYVRPRDLE